MKNFICENALCGEFYECSECGNHICAKQALIYKKVCPHCMGLLMKMN